MAFVGIILHIVRVVCERMLVSEELAPTNKNNGANNDLSIEEQRFSESSVMAGFYQACHLEGVQED